MISPKEIAEAVTAAAAIGWVGFTEWRLQKVQSANEILKRKLGDDEIEKKDHALTSDQLTSKLESELGPIARKS